MIERDRAVASLEAGRGRSQPAAPASTGPRTGRVLAAMCGSTVLVVGFVASINLAVPKLAAGSLHPSASGLLWIVDAYVAVFACLVIAGGAVGDRYGRKGTLLAGLGLFAAGAVISAAAPGVAVMLVGRVVTGIGAAAVLPNALATLVHAIPAERRAGAIAVWAAMTGIGGVVGNVGGGAVLSMGSWRWLFAVAALLALACLAWVAVAAPRTSRHDRRIDPLSVLFLTAATLALLVGIIQGPEQGWTSAPVLGGFAAAAVLAAAWVVRDLEVEHPLLDPRLMRIPRLRAACLGMFVVFFGLFGLFYLNASYLQYGRGFGLIRTGVAVVPLTVPLLVGARLVPGLAARIGAVVTVALAFALTGGGLIGLSTTVQHGSYAAYAAWLVVVGTGITLALPTLTHDITSSLPAAQAGVGGGLQATTRELGSAIGVAVTGTILAGHFSTALPAAVRSGGTRTVAEALARATTPALRHDVVTAYAASTSVALRAGGIVTLVAGALVTAQWLWSARAAR